MSADRMDEGVVLFFDTTLRDGEQSPGATLTSAEKLEIARQLARLGVDIIEAGFPAASPDDLAAVQRIAREVGTADGPVICGLARAVDSDILTCWEGVRDAAKPRIHTFLGTSDIHLKYQTGLTREEGLERIRSAVTLARSLCADVEFSPMDAGRTDLEYLVQVCALAVECGATTLNIPDTVGYVTPAEWQETIATLIAETPGAGPGSGVTWSVHCHNDLGLATANTLAGVMAGARQVEVTINGIGERAGNTSLEEVAMALRTRPQFFNLRTNINTREIMKTSRMVSNYTGMSVQPNKAIVGSNAFAHEAGIHQDGVLKNASTYEIMTPESVGLIQSQLVLGKHSGRHALKVRLQELGYNVDGDALKQVFARFKDLADIKKTVTDADLQALIGDELYQPPEVWQIEDVQVSCGTNVIPTAVVRLRNVETGEVVTDAGFGTGPVDAVYAGINRLVGAPNRLVEFVIQAIDQGMDAVGDVTIRIEADELIGAVERAQGGRGQRIFSGRGIDTDIVVASARAYLQALNKLLAAREERESVVAIGV